MSQPNINQLQEQIKQLTNSQQLGQFNSFLQKATDSIMCNSECQKQRQAASLRQKYINARTNLMTAPNQVQIAQKNYVTFTEGEPEYNELLEKQLQQKAELITQKFQENFNKDVKEINTQINTYSGILIHFKNIVELFLTYKKENIKLTKQLKEETNDVLTNERKTYYQDQEIDTLKYYYFYFLLTIYIIVVLCYIVFSLIYPSNTSILKRFGILIALIILPFISSFILGFIIFIAYKVYNLLPKNVYLSTK
jgi:hypothetical protein